jgi:hypothetical protein
MYNRSEINKFNETTKRMDLHCWNIDCPARKVAYTPHMGVLVRESERWQCWNYHLPFKVKNNWFAMEGKQCTRIHQLTGKASPSFSTMDGYMIPSSWTAKNLVSPIISVKFIPISTDNDMHTEAQKLFNRLMNLTVFT